MFFSFLLIFSFSISNFQSRADVFSPIYVSSNRTVNSWKLFGASSATEENIVVVPKIKNKSGAIWTNAILPKTNWSVKFDITVANPEEDFSFGIFYANDPSSDTQYHGGPSSVDGFALIGKFSKSPKDYLYFDLNFFQSDGTEDLRTLPLSKPSKRFGVYETFSISLTAALIKNKILISYDTGDEKDTIVIVNQLLDYNNYFLGITAKNTGFSSSLIVNEIHFDGIPNRLQTQPFKSLINPIRPSPYTTVGQVNGVYKNMIYKELAKAKILAHEFMYNPNALFDSTKADNVFDVIDEANRATYELATYKDLTNNLTTSFAVAVTKLVKRLNAATNSIKVVNNSFIENYDSVVGVINNFNSTIHGVFSELFEDTFNATSELINSVNSTSMTPINAGQSFFVHILYVLSAMEIIIVIFVTTLKSRMYENNYTKLPF